MKALIVTAIAALALAGCKEDKGLHLGNFKNDCANQKGTYEVISETSNEYKCTLPDGTVLLSKTK